MDPLLISGLNSDNGGLILLENNNIEIIDRFQTTDFYITNDEIFRVIGDNILCYYKKEKFIINFEKESHIHDILFLDNKLYVVKTEKNEILVFDLINKKIDQKIKFPGTGDAWHINCIQKYNNNILISAFGNFTKHREFKNNTDKRGFIMNLDDNKIIIDELSQPHSIKVENEDLWVCNSERKEIWRCRGKEYFKINLFDYVRGLEIGEKYIYVGISGERNDNFDYNNSKLLIINKNDFEIINIIELPLKEIYSIQIKNTNLDIKNIFNGIKEIYYAH